MVNSNDIAEAIRELSQVLSPQETVWYQSIGLWSIVVPLLIGAITFLITQRNANQRFRHDVSMMCMEKYRKVFENSKELNETNVQDYLGVIDEQLFYFRKHFIYKELVDEWLRNMINVLPIYYKTSEGNSKILNEELLVITNSVFSNQKFQKKLFPFPNIRKTIHLKEKPCQEEFIVTNNIIEGYDNLKHNDKILQSIISAMKANLLTIAKEERNKRKYRWIRH